LLALLTAAGCGDVCGSDRLPTCDIRQADCQRLTQEIVRCMRGANASTLPPVSVITPAQFEAYLRMGADPAMMREVEWEGALKMLRLIDPSADLFESSVAGSVANVLAYYTPAEKAVYVIDRGAPLDSVDAGTTQAHPLGHPAQDEEHDLGALLDAARTHEEVMRVRTVVEGEAMFYTVEATAWSAAIPADRIDYPRTYQSLFGSFHDALDATSSPYFAIDTYFQYYAGGRWETGNWLRGGDPAVRASLGDLPESTAWTMVDPFTPGRTPPPRASSTCDAPPPPPGFTLAGQDEMGAPVLYAFLHRWGMNHTEAWDIALRWARDDIYVYGDATTGRVALAWRIEVGDESAARWIAAQVDMGSDLFRTGYAGTSAILLTATDPDVPIDWTWDAASPECAPPSP
jgi:hypothetical protein